MREIRFRAWDNKEKAFVTEYNDGSNGMILFRGNDKPIATWKELTCACGGCGGCMDSYKDTDDIEVMQYTGLKDKNGKEIYEGDIVLFDNNLFSVEWNVNGSWCYMRHPKPFLTQIRYWESEVIGNIYENPELIK